MNMVNLLFPQILYQFRTARLFLAVLFNFEWSLKHASSSFVCKYILYAFSNLSR